MRNVSVFTLYLRFVFELLVDRKNTQDTKRKCLIEQNKAGYCYNFFKSVISIGRFISLECCNHSFLYHSEVPSVQTHQISCEISLSTLWHKDVFSRAVDVSLNYYMVIRASVKREFEESISSYDSVMPVFHASEFSFLSVVRLPFVIVLVAWCSVHSVWVIRRGICIRTETTYFKLGKSAFKNTDTY